MKVYTNINTLKKVKRLFDEIGLSMIFNVEAKSKNSKEKEVKAEEAGGLINSFFTGLAGFLPDFLKETLSAGMRQKISS